MFTMNVDGLLYDVHGLLYDVHGLLYDVHGLLLCDVHGLLLCDVHGMIMSLLVNVVDVSRLKSTSEVVMLMAVITIETHLLVYA